MFMCPKASQLLYSSHCFDARVQSANRSRVGKLVNTMLGKKFVTELNERRQERREAEIGHGRTHILQVQSAYETMIREGWKTVEGRLGKGLATRIRVGDTLVLGTTACRVKGVYWYYTSLHSFPRGARAHLERWSMPCTCAVCTDASSCKSIG